MKKINQFGVWLSDKIAEFGGSWSFIFWFLFISAIYMAWNYFTPYKFDPYWFPGLNLLLGFISSLTAPFMLMSGNRQSLKDRKKAEEDLKTDHSTNKIVKEILKKLEDKDVR